MVRPFRPSKIEAGYRTASEIGGSNLSGNGEPTRAASQSRENWGSAVFLLVREFHLTFFSNRISKSSAVPSQVVERAPGKFRWDFPPIVRSASRAAINVNGLTRFPSSRQIFLSRMEGRLFETVEA
jgi:hypothetical protein